MTPESERKKKDLQLLGVGMGLITLGMTIAFGDVGFGLSITGVGLFSFVLSLVRWRPGA